MNKTGINWCDYTWNPLTGCKHGCEYCYARRLAEGRLKQQYPQGFEYPTFHSDRLKELSIPKAGESVFIGSMTDMMGAWWPDVWIQRVMDTIAFRQDVQFLWLTKNPARYSSFEWPENCWLGTTVTSQKDERRIELLVAVKDVKRFVSVEPMLGPVELPIVESYFCEHPRHGTLCPEGIIRPDDDGPILCRYCEEPVDVGYGISGIDQIILGPETGTRRRPMKEEWAQAVEEQCKAAGVPFFRKDQNRGQLAWRTK